MPNLSTQPNRFYPNLPEIAADAQSHTVALLAIKEALQTHERRDNNYLKSFVRFEELVDLGLVDVQGNLIADAIGASGATTLEGLDDTDLTGQTAGDLLYNNDGVEWRNTEGLLQFNPVEKHLQLEVDFSVNWLDATATTREFLKLEAGPISVAGGGDPDFAFVGLLLIGEGTDGDTVYTSEDALLRAADFQVNSQLDDTQAPLADTTTSFYFDGTNNNRVNIIDSFATDILRFEDASFTIECWIRFEGTPASDQTWLSKWGASGGREWIWGWRGGDNIQFVFSLNGSNAFLDSDEAWAPNGDQWYFMAMTHDAVSGETKQYVDGVQIGTAKTVLGSQTIHDTNTVGVTLSGYGITTPSPPVTQEFSGWMSNVRITKGVVRYTGNFIPPTESFPAGADVGDGFWDDVSLLIYWDGSDGQSTSYNSEDKFDRPITFFDGAALSDDTVPFAGCTTSLLTDGINDDTRVASSANLNVDAGDFTIETWANWSSVPSTGQYVISKGTFAGNRSWLFGHKSDGEYFFNWSTNGTSYGTAIGRVFVPTVAQWYHIAVTREGANIRLFVDGAQVGATDTSIGTDTIFASTAEVQFAQNSVAGSLAFDGYLSNSRITKGVARYTSNFTPPTEKFPVVRAAPSAIVTTGDDDFFVGNALFNTQVRGSAINFHDEYTFPVADGTADQTLVTDGAGQLSFVDIPGFSFNDADYVHILGFETILGTKQFNSGILMCSPITMQKFQPINWSTSTADIEFLVLNNIADPDLGSVTFLLSGETGTAGLETISPEIGPDMDWVLHNGSQPSQVDGEVSTAQANSGTKSLYWKDQSGPPSAGWQSQAVTTVGDFAGDFTVEFDLYVVDWTSIVECIAKWDFPNFQWNVALAAGGTGIEVQVSTNGSDTIGIFTSPAFPTEVLALNTWHTIALSRVGDDWYLFLNGEGSNSNPVNNSSVVNVPASQFLVIGQEGAFDGSGDTEAYMDNVRITEGVGRYIADYTVSLPYGGSLGTETFIVGDPLFPTQVDGLTTNITSAATDIDGTLNVDGIATFQEDIIGNEALYLRDNVTVPPNLPGYSGLYVSNEVPNNLRFSDDGTSYLIPRVETEAADTHVAYWDSQYTLTGVAAFSYNDVLEVLTASRLRASATNDASLASTLHGFQVGSSNGANVRIDTNEIMAINDGVVNTLHINAEGGNVTLNNAAATGAELKLRQAMLLRFDATDAETDTAVFSIDPTDFSTTFTGLVDWNITGLTRVLNDSLFESVRMIAGDPGTEGTGITVNGATYESALKVSDLGGTNVAQMILHRHSTTLPPVLIAARTSDNTSGHTIVNDNDVLLSIFASGWDGGDYAIASEIRFDVDGTPAADDMPGQINFLVTPSGSDVPSSAMRIRATGNVEIDAVTIHGSYTQHPTFTDTQLDDVTDAVNTDVGKIQGAMVYNSTQDVPVWAVGSADGSVWVDGAGTTINTPV